MKAQKDPKIYYGDTQILRFGPDFLKKNSLLSRWFRVLN